MNLFAIFWNALKTRFSRTKTEAVAQVELAVETAKETVSAPIVAVEEKAAEVSDSVKAYVRDELGRFAKKETEVKEAAVEVANKIAGEPMTELTTEETKLVEGAGPHGSWGNGEGHNG